MEGITKHPVIRHQWQQLGLETVDIHGYFRINKLLLTGDKADEIATGVQVYWLGSPLNFFNSMSKDHH